MAGRNKGSSSYVGFVESDSEDYYDYEDTGSDFGNDFDLSLEKLNLGPKKKLLVLSLNGLLVYRVHRRNRQGIPKSRLSDGTYGGYLVFKRPFSQEFVEFCLKRFEVGIWSSAMERNIDEVLSYAVGASCSLFGYTDQNRCTDSGFKCLENKRKPLFLKELKKVWEGVKKRGPYSESNTLLIDDEPHRALFNPPNTGIFPEAYDAEDEDDKALDSKGELGVYLEGLAEANDVQSYVKEHSFGQPAITSTHPDWPYHSVVLRSLGKEVM